MSRIQPFLTPAMPPSTLAGRAPSRPDFIQQLDPAVAQQGQPANAGILSEPRDREPTNLEVVAPPAAAGDSLPLHDIVLSGPVVMAPEPPEAQLQPPSAASVPPTGGSIQRSELQGSPLQAETAAAIPAKPPAPPAAPAPPEGQRIGSAERHATAPAIPDDVAVRIPDRAERPAVLGDAAINPASAVLTRPSQSASAPASAPLPANASDAADTSIQLNRVSANKDSTPLATQGTASAAVPAVRVGSNIDATLYPQQLIASGHLSQQSTIDVSYVDAVLNGRAHAAPTVASAIAAQSGGAGRTSPAVATAYASSPAAAMHMEVTEHARRGNEATSSTGRLRAEHSFLVALPWAPKMLRVHSRDDGSCTVWLRDFSLDAESTRQLLQAVQRAASGAGSTPTRILINGHLAWSSTGEP